MPGGKKTAVKIKERFYLINERNAKRGPVVKEQKKRDRKGR